jgi:tetratricopeptide (TPR) repeat protein
MSTTTIKLQFNEDIRRVPVEKDKLTFQDLLTKITTIFKAILQGEVPRVVVRYMDNESDLCTVTSDEELQEAFRSSREQILKFVISITAEKKTENPEREMWHGRGMNCQFKKQFKKLHRDGISLMEEKKYQAARDAFLEQLKEAKSEWHQRIPLYNIACCDALLGNSDSALEHLEKAVNCGFRNLWKIKEDPDLESLRSLEKFQQLLTTVAERKEANCSEIRSELRKKCPKEWKILSELHQHPHCPKEWKNRGEHQNSDCPMQWKNRGEHQHPDCPKEWKIRGDQQSPDCAAFSRKCHWRKFVKNNSSNEPVTEKPVVCEHPIVIEHPAVVIEKPVTEEKPVVIEQPAVVIEKKQVPHKYDQTLATFEEMGFLNRDQNIEALNQVNGDAKLAISVILGLFK